MVVDSDRYMLPRGPGIHETIGGGVPLLRAEVARPAHAAGPSSTLQVLDIPGAHHTAMALQSLPTEPGRTAPTSRTVASGTRARMAGHIVDKKYSMASWLANTYAGPTKMSRDRSRRVPVGRGCAVSTPLDESSVLAVGARPRARSASRSDIMRLSANVGQRSRSTSAISDAWRRRYDAASGPARSARRRSSSDSML